MKRLTYTADQAHQLYKLNKNLSKVNESKLNSLVEHALKDLIAEQQTPTSNLEGDKWVSAIFANAYKLPNNLTLNSPKQAWETYFNRAVGSKYGSLMRQDAANAYNALMKRYNQQITMQADAGPKIQKPTTQNLSNEAEVKKYIQSLIKSGAISNFKEWENKAKQLNSIHDTNKVDVLTRQLEDSRGFPIFTLQQSMDTAGQVTNKSVIPGFNTSDIILFQRIFSKYWRLSLLPENEQAKTRAIQIPNAPAWADEALNLVIDIALPIVGVSIFSVEVIAGLSDFFQSEQGVALTRAFNKFQNLPELPKPNYDIPFKPAGPMNVVTSIELDGAKLANAIAGATVNENVNKSSTINELRAWHENDTLYVKVEAGDFGKYVLNPEQPEDEIYIEQLKANMMWGQMAQVLVKMYPDITHDEAIVFASTWTDEWNSTFGDKTHTYSVKLDKLSGLVNDYNALTTEEDRKEFLRVVTDEINAADIKYTWESNELDYIDAIRLGIEMIQYAPVTAWQFIAYEFVNNWSTILLYLGTAIILYWLGKKLGVNKAIAAAFKKALKLIETLIDYALSKGIKLSGEARDKIVNLSGKANAPLESAVDDIITYIDRYDELVKLAVQGGGPKGVQNLEFMLKGSGDKTIDKLVKKYGLDVLQSKQVAKEATDKLFKRTTEQWGKYFGPYQKYQQRLFNIVRDDKFIDVLLSSDESKIREYARRLISAAVKNSDIKSGIIKRGTDMVNMKALMDSIAKKTAALSRTSAQKKAGKAATSATQTSTGKGVTYTYKS